MYQKVKTGISAVFLFVIFLLLPCVPTPAEQTKILLIGNSAINSGSLDEVFAELTRLAGYDVYVDIYTPDTMSCQSHARSKETLRRIREKQWSYVVIQEHMDIMARKDRRADFSFPAIRTLDSTIKEIASRTIILMPWAFDGGLTSSGFEGFVLM